jgi:hypothetical protein
VWNIRSRSHHWSHMIRFGQVTVSPLHCILSLWLCTYVYIELKLGIPFWNCMLILFSKTKHLSTESIHHLRDRNP